MRLRDAGLAAILALFLSLTSTAFGAVPFGDLTAIELPDGCLTLLSFSGEPGVCTGTATHGEPAARFFWSPDGQFLYTIGGYDVDTAGTDVFGNDVQGYARAASGVLTPVNGASVTSSPGTTPWRDTRDFAFSPDGKSGYRLSRYGIQTYDRDPTTGALTAMSGSSGCVTLSGHDLDNGGTLTECQQAEALNPPVSVAVSPDSKSVYVTTQRDTDLGALLVFSRDTTTGVITQLAGLDGCLETSSGVDQCRKGGASLPNDLRFAADVLPSSDGKNVYVRLKDGADDPSPFVTDRLVTLARDSTTGAVSDPAGSACCTAVTDIHYIRGLAESSDGKQLYAVDFDRVRVLARDATTGTLSPASGGAAELQIADLDGQAGTPRAIALSPDGLHAYLGVSFPQYSALLTAARDPEDGALRLQGMREGCFGHSPASEEAGLSDACQAHPGVFRAMGTTVSADGAHVYLSSRAGDDNAGHWQVLSSYRRQAGGPNAHFTASPRSQLSGLETSFDASGSFSVAGSISHYEWDLDGDGSFETDGGGSPSATTTFTHHGPHTVRLRVTDSAAQQSVASLRLTAQNRPPTAHISAPAIAFVGEDVLLDASGSTDPDGSIAFYIIAGSGDCTASDTPAKRTCRWDAPGTYQVGATVIDDADASSDLATATIQIKPQPPVPAISTNPATNAIHAGQEVVLDGSGSAAIGGHIAKYEWDLDGDGTYDSGYNDQIIVSYTWASPGPVTLRLRITDDYGTTAVKTLSFTVLAAATPGNRPPVVLWQSFPASGLVGTTFQFSVSPSNDPDGTISKFLWDLDGNGSFETDTGTSPLASTVYTTPGKRVVKVRAIDDDGGIGENRATIEVTGATPGKTPPDVVWESYPASGAVGSDLRFSVARSTDPDGTITRYEWDLDGDGTFETNTGIRPTASIRFVKPGRYAVTVRVTDNDGLSTTSTVFVQVLSPADAAKPPNASFTISPSPALAGNRVHFHSTSYDPGGRIVRHEWDLDGDGVFETNTGDKPDAYWTYEKVPGGLVPLIQVGLSVTDAKGNAATEREGVPVECGSGCSLAPEIAGPLDSALTELLTSAREEEACSHEDPDTRRAPGPVPWPNGCVVTFDMVTAYFLSWWRPGHSSTHGVIWMFGRTTCLDHTHDYIGRNPLLGPCRPASAAARRMAWSRPARVKVCGPKARSAATKRHPAKLTLTKTRLAKGLFALRAVAPKRFSLIERYEWKLGGKHAKWRQGPSVRTVLAPSGACRRVAVRARVSRARGMLRLGEITSRVAAGATPPPLQVSARVMQALALLAKRDDGLTLGLEVDIVGSDGNLITGTRTIKIG